MRNLLRAPEAFVEFYAAALPRQVSSGATLEHFTRHLSDAGRRALALAPEAIFARAPDAQALAQFPDTVRLDGLAIPVDYRFAPGEAGDGATLKVPLLAVPTLTRGAVDAAIPGFLRPRVEAMLRSLPKEARRRLIPIGDAADEFLALADRPAADPPGVSGWLAEARGVPRELIRFDASQMPAHLTPRLAVTDAGAVQDSDADLAGLRRRCAKGARAALDRLAASLHGSPWRRFEAPVLEERTLIALEEGSLTVYPTLTGVGESLQVRFEWSAAEAARTWRTAAVRLARLMLGRPVADLARRLGADTRLLLAASPYFTHEEFVDAVLQIAVQQACFAEADAPRTRDAFEAAVDRGRGALYESVERAAGMAAGWFEEARAVRRLLEDARARSHEAAARETRAHLAHLLCRRWIESMPPDWLRQLPRYLKAQERRWQRLFARGGEAPIIPGEIAEWTARHEALEDQVGAERRWLPEVRELGCWIEEYRVSLYAQELKTLGPVSAARLRQRVLEIEAWIRR